MNFEVKTLPVLNAMEELNGVILRPTMFLLDGIKRDFMLLTAKQ
jgi:hypothetical protein